jgi:hypothetical protein
VIAVAALPLAGSSRWPARSPPGPPTSTLDLRVKDLGLIEELQKDVSGEKIPIMHVGWDPGQVSAYATGATRQRSCRTARSAQYRCSAVPGFRSYPVIWCTVGIVYAGQRLIAWSNPPRSLVTRPAAGGLLELRGLRFPLVTWQHRPQKASQVGPTWRLSAISAGGAGAVVAPAATTPAAASPVKKPGSPLLL